MNRRLIALLGLPWAGIITTNYDNLLELGFHRLNKHPTGQIGGFQEELGGVLNQTSFPEFFFVAIHGTTTGKRQVVQLEDFENVYIHKRHVPTFIAALLLKYNVVFIGTNVDEEILRLRRALKTIYCTAGENERTFLADDYVLLPDGDGHNRRREYLEHTSGLSVIPYRSGDKHQGLEETLEFWNRELSPWLRPAPGSVNAPRLGKTNCALLKCIASARSGLPYSTLTDVRSRELRSWPTLSRLSASEIHYRIFYLQTHKFITQVPENSGKYRITTLGRRELAKH